MPEQDQNQPVNKGTNWMGILIILAVIGWILSGFFSYSLKKTSDQLKKLQVSSSSIYSKSVTITKWQDVNGKAMPVTEIEMIRDQKQKTINKSEETKTSETWKSSFTIGPALSLTGVKGGVIDSDAFQFGPGALGAGALISPEQQWIWIRYRFLF